MRIFLSLVVLSVSLWTNAQTTLYIAAKAGLSIRDKPDTKGAVIGKIPYGAKVTVSYSEPTVPIITEGMEGIWAQTTYGGKTGYIVSSYLLPVPPPKATVKTMKEYLQQISTPFGGKLVVKSGNLEIFEGAGSELHKQLYKNGAEWHHFRGYEYGSDTYFLPDFSLTQGFLLLRMIAEFDSLWGPADEFPTTDKTYKKGETEYEVKIEKEMLGESPWYKRVKIEYADGAVYTFEMFQVENQLVIFMGSGV